MLRIYGESIETVRDLAPMMVKIGRKDRDLARQLRRCAASLPLNIAEGEGTQDGNRRLRFATALGSLREVRACLDVAEALGYIDGVDAELGRKLHALGGALYRLSH